MYQAEMQHNKGAFRTSPVKFTDPKLCLRHAEKLAEQFISVTDYRVRNTHTNQIVEFNQDEAL